MGLARRPGQRGGRTAAVVAACAALNSCAAPSQADRGGPVALFRAPVGATSSAVAPGLNSGWYVARRPVQFAQVGIARAATAASSDGLGDWLRRLFGRDATGHSTALVDVGSALPVPSLVEVTELASFRTITVRVDQRARLDGALILLPPQAAAVLGAAPGQPLKVRIRFAEPVLAYEERPTLRYALLGASAAHPAVLKAARGPPPTLAQAALPAPPTAAPAPGAGSAQPGWLMLALRPALDAEPPAAPAAREGFYVRVGAFARLANARRAVLRLNGTGEAGIVMLKKGPLVLYGVVVEGGRTQATAERTRARLVRSGFPDAEVLRPS